MNLQLSWSKTINIKKHLPKIKPKAIDLLCLPVAYKIQILDPGILGIPRAGPSLHFQLSPTTLLVKLNHSIRAPWFLSSSLWRILSLPWMSLFILFLSSSSTILSRFRAMTLLLQSLWILPSFEVLYHLNCSSFVVFFTWIITSYDIISYIQSCPSTRKLHQGERIQTQLSYSAP